MHVRRAYRFAAGVALVLLAPSCGGAGNPTSPSLQPLPVAAETLNFRYHYSAGDSVDTTWQERYHAWATAKLAVQVPQKIDYFKYRSRQDMGEHTGRYNTNGFADPSKFEIHTLWPTDNHEIVHIYTALVGHPSEFFNEGIAVAFQADPPAGNFESMFNGQSVHQSCRQYLQLGTLVPLDSVVMTNDFRAMSDNVLSYREAGSFMRFLLDTYGTNRILEFFRISGRDDDLSTIRQRFSTAVGVSLQDAEAAWTTMLSDQ